MLSVMIHQQVLYTGRVQGVGFRYCAKEVAKGYEVTGWVQNHADGSVELRLMGLEEEVRGFLAAVLESEVRSHIRDVREQVLPLPQAAYRDFRIL